MDNSISVIIPVYNSGEFLSITLDSIVDQLSKSDELILIDDGSTDNSLEIIKGYSKRFEFIKYYSIPNSGVSNARNIGIRNSAKEIIYFMDSDDIIEAGFVEFIKKNMGLNDCLIFGFNRVNQLNKNYEKRFIEDNVLASKEDISNFINGICYDNKDIFLNYLWNRVFRRSIIVNNEIYFDTSLTLGEDFIFNCEYLKSVSKIKVSSLIFYNYIDRNSMSLTKRYISNELERRKIMAKSYKSLLDYFNCSPEAYNIMKEIEGYNCLSSISKLFWNNCKISKAEKKQLIKEYFNYPLYEFICAYCFNKKRKINLFFKFFVKYKKCHLIYLTFALKNKRKR